MRRPTPFVSMPSLLLIDDDDAVRELLAHALAHAGYTVLQARNGREAAELFRVEPPDAVITDIIMPGREGIETIRTLRRDRPRLPIIAISGGATNSPLYLEIAAKLGACRVLAKPFDPLELVHAVDDALAEASEPETPP